MRESSRHLDDSYGPKRQRRTSPDQDHGQVDGFDEYYEQQLRMEGMRKWWTLPNKSFDFWWINDRIVQAMWPFIGKFLEWNKNKGYNKFFIQYYFRNSDLKV